MNKSREYLKEKINDLQTARTKISDLNRGINEFNRVTNLKLT
jgi:hypothetical protein